MLDNFLLKKSRQTYTMLILGIINGVIIGIYGHVAFMFIIAGLISLALIYHISRVPGIAILVLLISFAFDNFLVSIPLLGQISISKLIGILCMIGFFLFLVKRKKINFFIFNPQNILVLLFIIVSTISYFWANNKLLFWFRLERILFSITLYFVILIINSDSKSSRVVVNNLWRIIGFIILFTLTAYNIPIKSINMNFQAGGRFTGGMGDPNEFALFIVVFTPFILSQCLMNNRKIEKIFAWVALFLCLIALVQTQSRGGLIGEYLIGLISFYIFQMGTQTQRNKVLFMLIFVLFFEVVITILFPEILFRFLPGNSLRESIDYLIRNEARPSLWIIGYQVFKTNPLIGVGLGNIIDPALPQRFQLLSYGYRSTDVGVLHNGYLEIAAELGVVGILFYLLLIFIPIKNLIQRIKVTQTIRNNGNIHFLMSLVLSIIGFSIMIIFLSEQYSKIFWVLLALTNINTNLKFSQPKKLINTLSMERTFAKQ